MEPSKLDARDSFAHKLGTSGLSSLAQIKIAASNSKGNLDKIYQINEGNPDDSSSLAVRLYSEAIGVECAGILEAYNAYNMADDRTSLFLPLSEISYRLDRAILVCESLSTRLDEQSKHIEPPSRDAKELAVRYKEVIQIIKGAGKLKKHLSPIITSAMLFQ